MRPALFACGLLFVCVATPAAPSAADLAAIVDQVRSEEIAFAKTLADRRFDRFPDYVADDAVFNGRGPQIGRAAVLAAWKGFFDGPQAPFSWAPDAVAPAADGRHALSTGLVRDPAGQVIARFTSLWRKDVDGHWRVVADQGVDVDCK